MTAACYVIETRAGMERGVHRAIEHLRIDGFYPQHRREWRHAGRTEQVLRPLFPRYTLAFFDLSDEAWKRILRLPGVVTILPMRRARREDNAGVLQGLERQRPHHIPSDPIVKLRTLQTEHGGAIDLSRFLPRNAAQSLEKDTRVRVVDDGSVYCGIEGLVAEDHVDRVRVLLDFFGRPTPKDFAREAVAAVR